MTTTKTLRQVPPGKEPGERAPGLPAGQLSINEVYFTIQGECGWMGTPTVFVRTSHCPLRCVWCFGSDTRILMGDMKWKRIADVLLGDIVIGRSEKTRRLVRTMVTSKSLSQRDTVLVNGAVVTTSDHKFLEGKRWRPIDRLVGRKVKYVAPPKPIDSQRDYDRGYLAGVADGDGCFWTLKTSQKRPYRRFRLALNDRPILTRFQSTAAASGFKLHEARHGRSRSINGHVYEYEYMDALWLTKDSEAIRFQAWLDEDCDSRSWDMGYLAGIFDAEGSYSHTPGQGNHLRLSQHESVNPDVCGRIEKSLTSLGFAFTKDARGYLVHASRGAHLRFFSWCRPERGDLVDLALQAKPVNWETIRDVIPTGRTETVVDITTVDGSFVAEGYVVHNCDSKYTFHEGTPMRTEEVLRKVGEFPTKHVCLTGGEPLAQAEAFRLTERLARDGYTVEIETAGSEDVAPLNQLAPELRARVTINLDVKCPGSAMTNFNRWSNLGELRAHDQLKFILADRGDYEYAKDVLARHAAPCPAWLHPVWGKLEPAKIAEWVKADGLDVRVGVQLHKYLWGDVRGV